MFKTAPAVFAVNDTYQIMVRVEYDSLMWVKVGENCYYDDSNGILRSDTRIHRMTVPCSELDKAKSYTICERKIIERKPYFSETEDIVETKFDFRPVEGNNIRAYHIADTHQLVDMPVTAAHTYGNFDFLILNGDIPDHSGSVENFDTIYEICDKITHGNIPIIYSRGNHDTRGICAEHLAEYTPVANGKSYFTVRLGSFWALVLDCAEDKDDTSKEYGNTICCHAFRENETRFIEDVIKNAENEYMADGVTYKAVIVHNPFTRKYEPPFDIEDEIYTKWCSLLKENVKPDIMICGHKHILEINEPGCDKDFRGQPCTVVVGAKIDYGKYFAGTGFEFGENETEVTFTDSEGKILGNHIIK